MQKRVSIVALLVILLTLTPAISTATPTPAAPQVLKGSRPNVEHPHIRAAIGELREARQELEIAEHDFGGHRKEAIASVDVAIRQLQQALQYDKR